MWKSPKEHVWMAWLKRHYGVDLRDWHHSSCLAVLETYFRAYSRTKSLFCKSWGTKRAALMVIWHCMNLNWKKISPHILQGVAICCCFDRMEPLEDPVILWYLEGFVLGVSIWAPAAVVVMKVTSWVMKISNMQSKRRRTLGHQVRKKPKYQPARVWCMWKGVNGGGLLFFINLEVCH